MLYIRVLGDLVVEVSGGRPVDLSGSWRARSLLAWLALNPGSHPRTDLASRFWPDVLDSSARASLRNALWSIRRAVGEGPGEALSATRDRVGLDGSLVWVDSEAFMEHLLAGQLDEALALSRGELLADLDDEWVYEYRDAHRERLSELFEALAARAESQDDLAGAVAWSRRRAGLDPLAEDAHRDLFARMAASGDRAGALNAYERLRQRLVSEVGISPSETTRALVSELRRGRTPPSVRAAPVPPPTALPDRLAQAAASPWVGREQQLARLQLELERALRGESGLLMLTGEGGIGKTRLLAELAGGARGCAVLYGRCDEGELFPFGPFIEMLRGHLAQLPDSQLPALLGEAGPDLVRLLPELRSRLPDMPESPVNDPDTERARLFSAVVTAIARLAEHYPLLCILDDLHWADQSSLLLGKHLARAAGLGRVLLIGTYRDTELSHDHPLVEALADLERDQPIERIPLAGLGDEELGELAGAHDQQLDADTVHAIHDETQGNPFFAKQLLRHIEEEGATIGGDGLALPAGLRDVVLRRVARLPGAADAVLRVAALIGRDFDLEVLERVVHLPEDDVLDALDAAVRGGILVEVESTPERYSFVHALLRTILQEELTATRRVRLHCRIGDAIESLYADRLDEHLDDLARHFTAAGTRGADRAVAYAERAAEQATRHLAYEEAERLLADAVATRERDSPAAPLERARLLLALAGARSRAGHHNAARATYAEAAEAARAAGAAPFLARAALGHSGGSWDRYGNEDPDSARLLREALERLPDEDSPLRAKVLARLTGVLYYSPQAGNTIGRLAREAIDMARRIDDAEALAGALSAAQFAFWRPRQGEARLELAEELLEVTQRLGDMEAMAIAHAWRHGALLELCRRDEADEARAAHGELGQRLQLPELTLQAAAFRSTHALLDGRWNDAEFAAEDVLRTGERATALVTRSFYGGEMMALLGEQLRLGEMLEQFQSLAHEVTGFPGWRAVVAWAHAQSGRSDLALAGLEDLRRDGFGALPRDANYYPTLAILSHTAAELADAELAAQVEPLLRPAADLWVVMGVGGSVVGPLPYSLGLVSLLQGRHEDAAADFERALSLSRRMRARPYEAHSLIGLSRALEHDDPARAKELRDEALAIAHELGGMARLLRDAGG